MISAMSRSVTSISRTFMAAAAFSNGPTFPVENRAARGLAYSSAPKTMYDLAGGLAGLLFFVGVAWVAGLAGLDGLGDLVFAGLLAFLVMMVSLNQKGARRAPE